MFSIEMLPANEGDALWVEYGDPADPSRILIDCGYKSTYRVILERLRDHPDITFELFVMTHIDRDHIAGAVPFVADADVTTDRIARVWFNGREQIDDRLGAREAEYFTRNLETRQFAWNREFNGGPILVPASGPAQPIVLPGGLRLTILSPGRDQLVHLLEEWEEDLDKILKGRPLEDMLAETPGRFEPDVLGEPNVHQLSAEAFQSDHEAPNGSSIAFLAEYRDTHAGGRETAVLFTGDCFSPVLESSIQKLLEQRGETRLRLDAMKLAHHGSKKNTSPDLLNLIRCRHFLFSTSGSRFHHPDPQCVARVITSQDQPVDLHFNYLSDDNKEWRSARNQRRYGYEPHYPPQGEKGLTVTL